MFLNSPGVVVSYFIPLNGIVNLLVSVVIWDLEFCDSVPWTSPLMVNDCYSRDRNIMMKI